MLGLDSALVRCSDPSFGQRDDPVDGWEQLMGVCSGALHDVHLVRIVAGGGAVGLEPVGDNRRSRLDRGGEERRQRGRPAVRDDLHPGPAQTAVAGMLHGHGDHYLAQGTASPDSATGATQEGLIDFHCAG